jgi:hypothetical protein
MPASSPNRQVLQYRFTGIPNRIATAVYLYSTTLVDTVPLATKGIWDTGAQKSIITPYLADLLKVQPVNRMIVGGITGKSPADIVMITLEIPNNGIHKNLEVAVCPFNTNPDSDMQMLIGMDIISQGDFVLSNGDGYTLFSFATPASLNKIDLKNIDKLLFKA